MISPLHSHNIEEVLKEIEQTYWDIPFGNTDFQCENFVIAASITPERAFRTIGLQMHSLLTNLRQIKHDQRLLDIEIEELNEKVADESANKFERKRAQAKIELIESSRVWNEKMVMDAVKQFEVYYTHYQALPKYNREQFERGEKLYFEQSQLRLLLGIHGAKESIMNMVDDNKTIANVERMWAELPADKKQEMLEQISRQSIASMLEFTQESES